jgi:hypothetical protein
VDANLRHAVTREVTVTTFSLLKVVQVSLSKVKVFKDILFYCFALLLYNLHHYRVLNKGVIGG